MISRHQQRRLELLAQGLCPCCAGKNPIIPGFHFCAFCQIKSRNRLSHKRKKPALPGALPTEAGSFWDPHPDGLTMAIRQAEQDLQKEAV